MLLESFPVVFGMKGFKKLVMTQITNLWTYVKHKGKLRPCSSDVLGNKAPL